MFSVAIIAVGKMRNASYRSEFDEYVKRARAFAKLEIIEVPAVPFRNEGEIGRAKEGEGAAIKKALEKRTGPVYLLDERGRSMDSFAFAEMLHKSSEHITFVIGGTAGFSDELKQLYSAISLSSMTFPHELARVMLSEQIYRAVTLGQERGKYHY